MYWTPDPDHPVTKACTKCGQEKHLMEFYLKYSEGRRRPDCKACVSESGKRYYAANGPRCRAQMRRYNEKNRERVREQTRAWKRRNRERVREYSRQYRRRHRRREAVRRASHALVELGLLKVADRCEDCGGGPIQLHHPDYSDPWNVIPLCRSCHMSRHNAEWRRNGGGPVKYPEEYDGDE